jgi:hypothetical protein
VPRRRREADGGKAHWYEGDDERVTEALLRWSRYRERKVPEAAVSELAVVKARVVNGRLRVVGDEPVLYFRAPEERAAWLGWRKAREWRPGATAALVLRELADGRERTMADLAAALPVRQGQDAAARSVRALAEQGLVVRRAEVPSRFGQGGKRVYVRLVRRDGEAPGAGPAAATS